MCVHSCCRESLFLNTGRWTRSRRGVGMQKVAPAETVMTRTAAEAQGAVRGGGTS